MSKAILNKKSVKTKKKNKEEEGEEVPNEDEVSVRITTETEIINTNSDLINTISTTIHDKKLNITNKKKREEEGENIPIDDEVPAHIAKESEMINTSSDLIKKNSKIINNKKSVKTKNKKREEGEDIPNEDEVQVHITTETGMMNTISEQEVIEENTNIKKLIEIKQNSQDNTHSHYINNPKDRSTFLNKDEYNINNNVIPVDKIKKNSNPIILSRLQINKDDYDNKDNIPSNIKTINKDSKVITDSDRYKENDLNNNDNDDNNNDNNENYIQISNNKDSKVYSRFKPNKDIKDNNNNNIGLSNRTENYDEIKNVKDAHEENDQFIIQTTQGNIEISLKHQDCVPDPPCYIHCFVPWILLVIVITLGIYAIFSKIK